MYLLNKSKLWLEFNLLFRAKNWWSTKVPPLLVISYIFLSGQPEKMFYLLIIFFWIITTGCFGYFTNDWADAKADQKIGRNNKVAQLSTKIKFLISLGLIILFFLPWFILPVTWLILCLLTMELLLFIAYSFKPFHLKGRGWLGLIADASYAYVLPALIITLAFSLIGNWPNQPLLFLTTLLSWQVITGLRNALSHQIGHRLEDNLVKVKTFATNLSTSTLQKISQILTIIEIITLFGFLVSVANLFPALPLIYVVFVISRLLIFKPPAPDLANGLLNDFSNEWLGPIILLCLSFNNWQFILLLPIHLILFPYPIIGIKKRIGKILKNESTA